MPVQIGDGKLTLPEPLLWTLDIVTGEVAINKWCASFARIGTCLEAGCGGYSSHIGA